MPRTEKTPWFRTKITPENFKCAFIAAEGWGTFSQHIENSKLTAEISVRYGNLPLATLTLEHNEGDAVSVKQGDANLPATMTRNGKRVLIMLNTPTEVPPGETVNVSIV